MAPIAVTPTRTNKGSARQGLILAAATRVLTADWGSNTWPDVYVESSTVSVTVGDTTAGIGPPSAFVLLVLVEDTVDPAGNFVTATGGSTLSTGVLAILNLGQNPAPGVYTIGNGLDGAGGADSRNAALTKFGTFRLVIATGNDLNAALRIADGAGAGDFHEDSDGNSSSGAGDLVANSGDRIDGVGGVKCKLTTASRTGGNWGYPDQITASFTLKSSIDGTSGPYTNAALKNMRACWSTESNPTTSIVKETSDTIDSSGVIAIPATNIDSAWGQVVGGSDFYTELGVGQVFGDVSTPANEKAAIYAVGITDAADNEQMAYVFTNGGHFSPYVSSSDPNRRIRTNTADQKASAAEQITVSVFGNSGRTTAQNLFRRTEPTNTDHAIPFLRVVILDAYGVAIPNATSHILSVRSAVAAPMSDTQDNTQTLTTGGGTGTIDWSYTIAATHAAFSRFVKTGSSRVAGSHVATGPDSTSSPPATFNTPGAGAAYTGPFPAYPKDVRIVGNAFAGVNEPSTRQVAVFGVNSEIIFEDIWTGSLTSAALDGNGVPTGAGSRELTLGAGSLKAKLTTEINEGTAKVIDLTEHNPKDVAGRNFVVTTDNIFLRRALFNSTAATVDDAGTDMTDAQTKLDNSLGYHVGNNSLDSIAAPADPGSFLYYIGGAATTTQRSTLSLSASGGLPVIGFTGDASNFGFFTQSVAFVAADLTIAITLTPRVVQADIGTMQRFGAKVSRITQDIPPQMAAAHPDTAPVYFVLGLNEDGTQTFINTGTLMTAIGDPMTTSDYYFDVTIPGGFPAIKVRAFAQVNGSRTPGGDSAIIQIGYTLDVVGMVTGLQYK